MNGDVVRSSATGRLAFLTDTAKAAQSLARLGGLNRPQGAGLSEVISTVPENEFALSAAIQTNIQNAFDALVSAQRSAQLNDRSTSERLATIVRMYVTPANFGGGNVKTSYAYFVGALTVSGLQVTTGAVLVPPQGG